MRICDKCGKKHADHRIIFFDLCDECRERLIVWVGTPLDNE